MKKCPHCAEEIQNGGIKCENCGNLFVTKYLLCPKCNKENWTLVPEGCPTHSGYCIGFQISLKKLIDVNKNKHGKRLFLWVYNKWRVLDGFKSMKSSRPFKIELVCSSNMCGKRIKYLYTELNNDEDLVVTINSVTDYISGPIQGDARAWEREYRIEDDDNNWSEYNYDEDEW